MAAFDVVIIGGGPGGERAAVQAARAGKRVAVVERANVVGGTCINWGTIPSKTLRESAVFLQNITKKNEEGIRCEIPGPITIGDFMVREKLVVQRELELINKTLDGYQIEVFHGHARFLDPHTVAVIGVDNQSRLTLQGEIIIIATGSAPNHPSDVVFDGTRVLDSDTVLKLSRMPRSMIVLGAGVIGVEYASIFSALGLQVTLVDTRETLLPYLDREISVILERELRRQGIVFVHDDQYATIEVQDGPAPMVRCETRAGNTLEGDVLLYCVGRDGNTKDLGLEQINIQPTPRGLLEVNEHYQTSLPHIYAVGDVIGYPALASTSMDQGRRAIRHALGLPRAGSRGNLIPYGIYSIPEVSTIGETEESLKEQGVAHVIGRGRYDYNPRGQIMGELGGLLKLLCEADTGRLVGVHIVGYHASELIHIGQTMINAGSTAEEIADTLFNYPTLSDLYRHAGLEALASMRRSKEAAGGKDDSSV